MADIIAKLAQVVTSAQIAINAGSAKGVKRGDRAVIFRVVNIEDPDTKEPLGSVRVPRLVFKVTSVVDNFCLADVETVDVDNPLASNVFSAVSIGGGRVKLTTGPATGLNSASVKIGEEITIQGSEPALDKT